MTFEALLFWKSVVVVATLLFFATYERVRPSAGGALLLRVGAASKRAWRRLGRNLGLFSLNALLGPLLVVPVTLWAESFSLGLRPAFLSGGAGLAFDILLLDCWIYWWHRLNHQSQFLWRFHQVHHLDETLDTSTGVRFHAGEVALSALVRAIPIILLDIPFASVIVAETLLLIAAIFQHSDAKLPPKVERVLSKVVVTPSIHWIHHHAKREDTDSNYANIFSFWDVLFGTRSATERWPAMPIGVERMRDRRLLRLLWAPFGRQPKDPARRETVEDPQ